MPKVSRDSRGIDASFPVIMSNCGAPEPWHSCRKKTGQKLDAGLGGHFYSSEVRNDRFDEGSIRHHIAIDWHFGSMVFIDPFCHGDFISQFVFQNCRNQIARQHRIDLCRVNQLFALRRRLNCGAGIIFIKAVRPLLWN